MTTATIEKTVKPNTAELLPLNEYDKIIVSYSGGKDSLDCILTLLDAGAKPEDMELWHQAVDGDPASQEDRLMDWPCTEGYFIATGKALGIRTRFQWKHGGFEREMLRKDSRTAPVSFERHDGEIGTAGGVRGNGSTREKFPQKCADLSQRWCSPYLKIDVAAMAMNNDPWFLGKKTLFVTGERRQEGKDGKGRALYAEIEEHRCHTRRRLVHQWRAVIDHSEEQVWDRIKKHRIQVHPAYYLGYGRVSCMACIFSDKHQWATTYELDPKRIHRITQYEERFGITITKGRTALQMANEGQSFIPANMEKWRQLGMTRGEYPLDQFFTPEGEEWVLPAGAYKRCGGPI